VVLKRNIELETDLSKAIAKLNMAQRELYPNKPFALKLMNAAEKDLSRAQISIQKSLGIKMRT